ncbi:MAG TPA: hypothetical protein VES01_08765 [Dermatophilaceae bacterium]|nr:hypothetical protein [Dermatophilaceae bacterium]
MRTPVVVVDADHNIAPVRTFWRLRVGTMARDRGTTPASLGEAGTRQWLAGYVIGGIRPFGQHSRMPTVLDDSVMTQGDSVGLLTGARAGISR